MSEKWTNDELIAAVDVYVSMLEASNRGETVVKSDEIRTLLSGRLTGRTKGSVEYRFANISAVLETAGKPWLEGYVPARNVGPTNEKKIRAMLMERGLI